MREKKTTKLGLRVAPAAPEIDYVVSETEAAGILGFSRDSLRRAFAAGRAPARVRISARRVGYRLSELYRFLDTHTEKPGA
jgi:predicted DNA-binding transcriptional regulator AlpA